jgi:hypothetical protein
LHSSVFVPNVVFLGVGGFTPQDGFCGPYLAGDVFGAGGLFRAVAGCAGECVRCTLCTFGHGIITFIVVRDSAIPAETSVFFFVAVGLRCMT